MTSKIIVNNIEPDAGISTVTFNGNISGALTGNVTGNLTGNVNSSGVSTFSSGIVANVTGNLTGNVNSSGVSTFSSGIVVAAGSTAAPSITPTGDSNTGIFFPAADTIAFGEGGSEAARIDSSGRFGLGTTTPGRKLVVAGDLNTVVAVEGSTSGTSNLFLGDTADEDVCALGYNHVTNSLGITVNASASPAVTIDSSGRLLVGTSSSPSLTDGQYSKLHVVGNSNSANGGGLINIGRGALASSVLNTGVSLGDLQFTDSAGAVHAAIGAQTDATTGSNDYPGRLIFSTTSDGASSPTERARITSAGYFKATNTGSYDSSTGTFHELVTSNSGSPGIKVRTTDGNYNGTVILANADRPAATAYWFVAGISGNGADTEFYIRGDGNAYADGSWNGGGADYAEYFEWSDANPNEEDRRGISVVLDGNKVREAVAGEDPIGVISGNPSVVGDAAGTKWSSKYLRDEFGSYLLNENGDRQLNPAYDPAQEYIPREQRPEWDCVGLMGKLRIRKGQVTGSRWIKMRDISDSVEEWLVR